MLQFKKIPKIVEISQLRIPKIEARKKTTEKSYILAAKPKIRTNI